MPPSAASNSPARWSTAPVNAPFSWPNSSLSSSVSGSAPQLTDTNGARGAARFAVDRAGHQLLAGAALAVHQHRAVAGRHPPDHGEHVADLGTLADDLGHAVAAGDDLPQHEFSRRSAFFSAALRTTSSSSTFFQGLATKS